MTSKVLAIIEAFEALGSTLALTQIAEATRVPLSMTHRLVGEMVGRAPWTGTSTAATTWGCDSGTLRRTRAKQLHDIARPFLQGLFSLTQETSHPAIREGYEALYIDRVYSSKRVPRASRVGGRLPLHATAVGTILLAYVEPWRRDAYVSRSLATPTKRPDVNPTR